VPGLFEFSAGIRIPLGNELVHLLQIDLINLPSLSGIQNKLLCAYCYVTDNRNTFGNFVRTGFTQTNTSPVEREHYRVNEMPSFGTHDSSDVQEDPHGASFGCFLP
jgi:hypothetical protein